MDRPESADRQGPVSFRGRGYKGVPPLLPLSKRAVEVLKPLPVQTCRPVLNDITDGQAVDGDGRNQPLVRNREDRHFLAFRESMSQRHDNPKSISIQESGSGTTLACSAGVTGPTVEVVMPAMKPL